MIARQVPGFSRIKPLSKIDFDDVAAALSRANASTTAAECHGTLCGMYMVSGESCQAEWLTQALSECEDNNALTGECRSRLESLFVDTQTTLEGEDLSFAPLLPDDEADLAFRTEQLAQWCQGFLFGLSTQGISDVKSLPPEVAEIVGDFSEITKAAFDSNEDVETSEQAYADLTEFVRIGVQLVLENLNPKAPKKLH